MAEKKFYVGIKAVIYDNLKGVLLLRSEKGFWDFPGGRVDDDESFEDTLDRELAEEIEGCKLLSIKKLLSADRLYFDLKDDISLVLLCFLVDVDLPADVLPIDDHNGVLWIKSLKDIPKKDIKKPMIEAITAVFENNR